MNEQYGGRTQLTGITAGVVMIVILLCGTGFIGYLPVPVLTAIVISALYSAMEFDLAARLWKVSKVEFYIFCGAFLGVLLLGTINGVLIGMILSFVAVIKRQRIHLEISWDWYRDTENFLPLRNSNTHIRYSMWSYTDSAAICSLQI